jgi:hypothetical protein
MPAISSFVVANGNFFADDMEVSIIGISLPNWCYWRIFTDLDRKIIGFLLPFLYKSRTRGTAVIKSVDPETNTIWFSTPLPKDLI